MPTPAPLSRDISALATLFAVSGTIHLVRPETYEPIVPRAVPAKREVVYASGVAELLCAAGLLHPRTRRLAGWASAGLLLGVFPANVKMAKDAVERTDKRPYQAATLARLPLQWPMIRSALRAAGRV